MKNETIRGVKEALIALFLINWKKAVTGWTATGIQVVKRDFEVKATNTEVMGSQAQAFQKSESFFEKRTEIRLS